MVFSMRNDERVMQYIRRPGMQHIDEAAARIKMLNGYADEGVSIMWVIALNGQYTGSICLWNFSPDETIAEVGYDLHPGFWGQGIMTEALTAIIDYAFNTLKLKAIEAFTDKANTRSVTLLQKNGFVHQPERTDEGNSANWILTLVNPG